MIRTLLWDTGPGEVRAGLVEAGVLTELRILRPRRGKPLPAAGELFTARVLRSFGPNKAMVAIGGGQEALLQPARGLNEGALLAVEMTRAPIPEPGQWKLPQVRPAPAAAAKKEPGWHGAHDAPEAFLHREAARISAIVCRDARSANSVRDTLTGHCPEVRIDPGAIAEADFSGLIDSAVTGEFPIGEGMLCIERTRAMTMIDIDGSGDPLTLNLAAAAEIGRLLRLLDIGGQVGIDFVTLDDRKARSAVDAALADACAPLGPHKCTAMNGFGFVQLIRPRSGPSLPEMLCGTLTGRLSLESRAIALLRDADRSIGHGPRRMIAPPAIVETIRQWPDEVAQIEANLGTAIELVADPAATGYGHVHVSQ